MDIKLTSSAAAVLAIVLVAGTGTGLYVMNLVAGNSTQTTGPGTTTTNTTTTTTVTLPVILIPDQDLLPYNITVPDWVFPLIDGTNFTVSSMRGTILVLDFFATWCSYCAYQNRAMVDLYGNYTRTQLDIVSITLGLADTAEMLEDYMEEYLMEWRCGFGTDEIAADYLGIMYIPTLVFIDSQGILRWIHEGTWGINAMTDLVDNLLT